MKSYFLFYVKEREKKKNHNPNKDLAEILKLVGSKVISVRKKKKI
ncbi:RNA polymerase subunit sigma-54 [Clostridioides difficile]|nr:RNA polymerase subunit sigma-54 [Clostridioides difficile]